MPKKLKVFLCHSSNDKPAVREIYARLKSESWIEPWLDEEELYPGQDWGLEIEKAVEEADTVLVFLSNNAVTKKGYVQKEVRMVLRISDYQPDGTIFTIPLRLENCAVPRSLSMWQYVDLFPESRKNWAYGRLLGSLKIRAEKLGIDSKGKVESGEVEKEERRKKDVERKRIEKREQEKVEKERIEKREKEEAEKKARRIAEDERVEKRAHELALEIVRKEREEREEEKARELAKEIARKTREEKEKKEKARKEKEAYQKKLAANPANIEWIKIPAGEFTMGSNDGLDREKPSHKVYLDAYLIAKTPVTNAQFKKFIEAGGYKNQKYWSDTGWVWLSGKNRTQPSYWHDKKWNTPTHPVVGVSWYESEAFSKWANCRLPSEAEWEKAARGDSPLPEGEGAGVRVYPWGNQTPNKNLANFNNNIGKTTPVGKYSPAGDSPYGCVDMAGNVWEWMSSTYKKYPYDAMDGREDLTVADAECCVVVRGTAASSASAPPIAAAAILRLRSAISVFVAPAHALDSATVGSAECWFSES